MRKVIVLPWGSCPKKYLREEGFVIGKNLENDSRMEWPGLMTMAQLNHINPYSMTVKLVLTMDKTGQYWNVEFVLEGKYENWNGALGLRAPKEQAPGAR